MRNSAVTDTMCVRLLVCNALTFNRCPARAPTLIKLIYCRFLFHIRLCVCALFVWGFIWEMCRIDFDRVFMFCLLWDEIYVVESFNFFLHAMT